ncbi:MAG TPA: serine hydrolase domain-containing protein [Candidatus Limnocylindrales bacterium]
MSTDRSHHIGGLLLIAVTMALAAQLTSTAAAASRPAAAALAAATTDATVRPSTAAKLQSILDEQRNLRHIPGIAAAMIFPDGSIWNAGSGYAQFNTDELATPKTPFVVASITKTFVTAAIMQLADEGKLSIDDPLSNWLPGYPNAVDITLRELLAHTSGVFNYLQYPGFNRIVFKKNAGHFWTPQEILDTFAHAPNFAPGEGFHYSNTGFILLGLVIEAVTGQALGDVFAQRFFIPLGLNNTYFQGSGPPPSSAAQGYGFVKGVYKEWSDGSSYRPGISGATVSWSAGAIASSARDIAKWCAALYGGHVVSAKALSEMEAYTNWYGLGTWTRVHSGRRMFGHIGSFHGFDAAMWYYPSTGLTVVVLTNLANISANPIADALADAVQG